MTGQPRTKSTREHLALRDAPIKRRFACAGQVMRPTRRFKARGNSTRGRGQIADTDEILRELERIADREAEERDLHWTGAQSKRPMTETQTTGLFPILGTKSVLAIVRQLKSRLFRAT